MVQEPDLQEIEFTERFMHLINQVNIQLTEKRLQEKVHLLYMDELSRFR